MGGDKAAQERLKAKAEEAEAERQAVLRLMEAEKQNPVSPTSFYMLLPSLKVFIKIEILVLMYQTLYFHRLFVMIIRSRGLSQMLSIMLESTLFSPLPEALIACCFRMCFYYCLIMFFRCLDLYL